MPPTRAVHLLQEGVDFASMIDLKGGDRHAASLVDYTFLDFSGLKLNAIGRITMAADTDIS